VIQWQPVDQVAISRSRNQVAINQSQYQVAINQSQYQVPINQKNGIAFDSDELVSRKLGSKDF
jgi:hypothetical protein